MQKTASALLIKLSNILSNVLNPLFSLLIFFIYFAKEKMETTEAFKNLLWMVILVIIPIFGWIFWNVKTGRYTNMDVSDRKQRNSLYLFNVFIVSIYIAFLYFTQQNFDLILIIIFVMALMLIMHFSNFFIKSSMHTSFNVFVSALFFSLNIYFGLFWLFLTILVGISRVILKRHTVKEVIMGASIATVVSFIYLYFNIQNQ
jgi:membrane-associated phospholipid phosphatase